MNLLRNLYSRPSSAFGITIVLAFLLLAIAGPLVAPYEATTQVRGALRRPPSLAFPFGTDRLGRDVLSRVILGTRDVFTLAGVGTLVAVALGATLGLLGGYVRGWFDEALFRVFDALLALPALLLALLLLGTVGPSRNSVLLVIVIVYTPIVARVVRSATLTIRGRGFVEAARVRGEPLWYILGREILPSVLPTLAVEAALRFSYAIFLVSSLGFLGVGVQPPSPDWGLMVSEARNYATLTPWALYFPMAAIGLLVIGANLAADGLRRVLLGEDV